MGMLRKKDTKRDGWIRGIKKELKTIIYNEILGIKTPFEEWGGGGVVDTLENNKIKLHNEEV
jgi:hypothetical protein